jgi:NADPH2:quinone reductase
VRALGYKRAGPIDRDPAFEEFETPIPQPGERDLLVAVHAVSVNPVDTKIRAFENPKGELRILGFDAAGVVVTTGSAVTLFREGDEVFYAGVRSRPGCNAEFQLVDERIVGHKPVDLSFPDAAALPLTAITAWEMLFESFGVAEGGGRDDALLIIGAAGGVGSIMIQLAKKLTRLNVVATASRPDTADWARKMGADHVIDHRNSLDGEIGALGIIPRYVAALTHTDHHLSAILKLIKPRGHIGVIDNPVTFDTRPAKYKAISSSWVSAFARPLYQTADMQVQHEILERVSDMVDQGELRTTAYFHAGALNAVNLTRAHKFQESGKSIGKTVLESQW